jgi:8-amino-7-oxononanoate synthase
MQLLRYGSRPYIFTASSSPANIAAADAALHAIRTRPDLRQTLRANADRLYDGLKGLGYELASPVSPVIAVRVPSAQEGARLWNALLSEGVYANLVLPPAAPDSAALLRCSLSAAHSFEQIDAVLAAFRTVMAGSDGVGRAGAH